MNLYRLEHSTIGRKTHPRDPAFEHGPVYAHARYITNPYKVDETLAVNFPTNIYAFRDEVRRYEDWYEGTDPETGKANTRKNARVLDKIVITLPAGMERDHQVQALRAFGWKLSGYGRARVFIACQNLGDHNPHAHIFLVDRATDTGEQVAKLSLSEKQRRAQGLEPNGTQYLRKLWDRECNAVLAANGYDIRIDHRSYLERGIDRQPEPHRGPDNDNAPESPVAPFAEQPVPLPDQPEVDNEEPFNMAEAVIVSPGGRDTLTRITNALQHDADLQWLRGTREEIRELERQKEVAAFRAEQARTAAEEAREAATNAVEHADERVAAHRAYERPDGSLRGFHLKLWVLDWKSPTRVAAEASEAAATHATREATSKTLEAADLDHYAKRQADRQAEVARDLGQREAELSEGLAEKAHIYGDGQTLEEAELVIDTSVRSEMDGVTAEEVMEQHEKGALTPDQTIRALELAGAMEQAEEIRLAQERDRGVELDQS